MKYLGTKFIGTDSSVFIIDVNKKSIFAMSTERVTRKKHDPFDVSPIFKTCNELQGEEYIVSIPFSNFKNVDFSLPTKFIVLFIVVSSSFRNRLNKINFKTNKRKKLRISDKAGIVKFIQNVSILGQAVNKPFVSTAIKFLLWKSKVKISRIEYCDHHLSHAHASYFLSHVNPKENTLAISIDGFGDGYWIKAFSVKDGKFKVIGGGQSNKIWNKSNFVCSSLGEVYGNFTEVLGYKRNSDEGKVEALAAFGTPDKEITELLWKIFDVSGLDIRTNKSNILKFYDLKFLNANRVRVGTESFAASIQNFLEEFIVFYILQIQKVYNFQNICLSGGVCANIIMNLRIYETFPLCKLYIAPAMGDDGSSAGAAIQSALKDGHNLDWLKSKEMPYYGQEFSQRFTLETLKKYEEFLIWKEEEFWENDAAISIDSNMVIAVFQGRMEFGPRALGNRSILANPTNPYAREILNKKIKVRPVFQPFCPSILSEERDRLFKKSFDHKYMATAFRLNEEYHQALPSLIHVDGTARPQFVDRLDNESFWKILKSLKDINGFGAVINTSFNLHGRAIVRTPDDAVLDFLACKLDILYINGIKVTRRNP